MLSPIGSWSGTTSMQGETFGVDAHEWRIYWETKNGTSPGAGTFGIYATTLGTGVGDDANTGVEVDNTGAITAVTGIYARTFGDASGPYSSAGIDIHNQGNIDAGDFAIHSQTTGNAEGDHGNVGIAIENAGRPRGLERHHGPNLRSRHRALQHRRH